MSSRRITPGGSRGGTAFFTLIELLVVAATLAILMGILLPAIGKARERGKKINCVSNIRQLGLILDYYTADYDGHYFLACEDLLGANNHRWHGVRDSHTDNFDPSRGYLALYLDREARAKDCPSMAPFRDADWDNSFEKGCGGYGYNYWFIGSRAWELGQASGLAEYTRNIEVKKPSETVGFCDTGFLNNGHITEYSMIELPYWDLSAPYDDGDGGASGRPDPVIHFRHMNETNVLWIDGHVAGKRMDFTIPSYLSHGAGSPAKYALGWFLPDDYSLFDLE